MFHDADLQLEPSDGDGPIIAQLPLPGPGVYVAIAKLQTKFFGGASEVGEGWQTVKCRLQSGADFDRAQFTYVSLNQGGFFDWAPMTLTLVFGFDQPSQAVSLRAAYSEGAKPAFKGAQPMVHDIKITAIRVGFLRNLPI